MTESRYVQLFGEAMDALYRRIGVDEAYRGGGRMFYSVETHVMHTAEARVGEPLFVATHVLSVDDKRLHVFHRVHRARDGAAIASGEQMHLHVDTAAGRAAPMDGGVRSRLEAIRDAQSRLPVPAEVGRHVGQRR